MIIALANVSARLKVDQVKDRLRALIYEGKLSAGQRLPPERDMAKQFGVSTPTLNKAMAALESEGLFERTVGRGTFVREGVVAGGTVPIVFDWRHITSGVPFYDALMKALIAEVGQHKMRPQFVLGRGETVDQFSQSLELKSPLWQHAVGVLAMAWRGGFEEVLEKIGKPLVMISALGQGRHCVLVDYEALIRMSCEHLAARGYREIGLISHSETDTDNVVSSFDAAMSDLQLTTKQPWRKLNAGACPMGGRKAIHQLWEGHDRPKAIVVADDNTAVGVGQAIRELGIRCPDDLAVISHGTIGVDLAAPLEFTRCCFDLREICKASWAFLDRLIAGDNQVPAVMRVKPQIVQGKTT